MHIAHAIFYLKMDGSGRHDAEDLFPHCLEPPFGMKDYSALSE